MKIIESKVLNAYIDVSKILRIGNPFIQQTYGMCVDVTAQLMNCPVTILKGHREFKPHEFRVTKTYIEKMEKIEYRSIFFRPTEYDCEMMVVGLDDFGSWQPYTIETFKQSIAYINFTNAIKTDLIDPWVEYHKSIGRDVQTDIKIDPIGPDPWLTYQKLLEPVIPNDN